MQTNSNHRLIEILILNDGMNVYDFLHSCLKLSRSSIKKYSFKKNFLDKEIKRGDLIALPFDLVNTNCISYKYTGPEVEIIDENQDFLILNKPNNIHGHPLNYLDTLNILSFIRSRYNYLQLCLRSNNKERGLLYRLDQVTSGVLIFCKDEGYAQNLRENFEQNISSKVYLSIVEGDFENTGEHCHYFEYCGKKGKKALVNASGVGKKAEMIVSKIDYNCKENLSLVKIILKTGLRHQIRAQLSFLGFPILGDLLYGGRISERVFLHAYEYSLVDKNNQLKTYTCKKAEGFNLFFKENNYLD